MKRGLTRECGRVTTPKGVLRLESWLEGTSEQVTQIFDSLSFV